jgi:hypothetical protein
MRSFNYTTRQCDDFCFTPEKIPFCYCLVMRSRRPPYTTIRGNLGVMASVSIRRSNIHSWGYVYRHQQQLFHFDSLMCVARSLAPLAGGGLSLLSYAR